MPRMPRLTAIDYPYHVTQRGNYQQNVFENRGDYLVYIKYTEQYAKKYGLEILAYCLMPNHVHFIAVPRQENALAKTYKSCHARYAHYFNKQKSIKGHLWQNRYHSCILDDRHLYAAIRYVENNPVDAKLVDNPQEWEFSSAAEHLYGIKGNISLSDISEFVSIKDWGKYLNERENKQIIKNIEENTLRGRPAGMAGFVEGLENKFKVRLRTLPRGGFRSKVSDTFKSV